MEGWNPRTLQCFCHDQDVCPEYEAECYEHDMAEWWDSLTDEERESYKMRLCNNCSHAFTPTDDDGEQEVCADCVDWLDVEEEYGVNF